MAVIDATRKTDWSYAGVTGGIPTSYTKDGATVALGTTIGTINARIAAAGDSTYIEFAAGTFNLAGGINIRRNNVILRGQGMSTIFNFTSNSGANFFWNGSAGLISVEAVGGADFSGYGSAPGMAGVPSSILSWTGTNGSAGVYTQGATVLDVGAAPTGLAAGGTITLWQADPADASLPVSGYFVSQKSDLGDPDNNTICWQGSGQSQRAGCSQRARVTTTSGTQITIAAPGIYRPAGTWATGNSPKAGWQTNVIKGVGIENIQITHALSSIPYLIGFDVAAECWVKGVGFKPPTTGSGDYCMTLFDARNMTIRDNWLDPMHGGGTTTTSYGVALFQCSGVLVENNVFNDVESPMETLSGSTGCVFGYNYEHHVTGEGGIQCHEDGASMNLYEGNAAAHFWADFFHGNTNINTIFRNNFTERGIDLIAYHRWYNLVGNVITASVVYKTIYSDTPPIYDRFTSFGFRFGYASELAIATAEPGQGTQPDQYVAPTTMIWGNYATLTSSVYWVAAEVPSTDPTFPNPVPTDHTLPSSYYLSGRPSWWGNITGPFPLIGPDVTGGDVTGYSGHVYTLPTQKMYTVTSGNISNFNPNLYYASTPAATGGFIFRK